MKIVTLGELRKMPKGTVFAMWSPCVMSDCDDPIYNARNELGLKDELPDNLLKLVKGKYYHPIDYGKWQDTIKAFLEEEI